jgi:hypothetical protein
MRARTILILVLAGVVVVPVAVAGVWYAVLQQSRRSDRDVIALLPNLWAGVDYLSAADRQRTPRAVNDGAGEDFKQAGSNAYVTLELSRVGGPAGAEWDYRSAAAGTRWRATIPAWSAS